jgi:hypothetical protein
MIRLNEGVRVGNLNTVCGQDDAIIQKNYYGLHWPTEEHRS